MGMGGFAMLLTFLLSSQLIAATTTDAAINFSEGDKRGISKATLEPSHQRRNLLQVQCSDTKLCANNLCCSQFGFCGSTPEYCGNGCKSGCPKQGGFTLYEHSQYGGRTYPAPIAAAGCNNLYPTNNFNDQASSIQFNWAAEPTAAAVTFFEHGDCLGLSWFGIRDNPNIPWVGFEWNDRWSSYKWTLATVGFTIYEHSQYGGRFFGSRPQSSNPNACANLNDFDNLASSVTFNWGPLESTITGVTFYEDGGCAGRSWFGNRGTSNLPDFSSDWNDRWSSYKWTSAAAASPPVVATSVSKYITAAIYAQLFPNPYAGCPGANFYNFANFLAAANSFPGFGTSSDDITNKRELAAFFGQASQETNGAPVGRFDGGLCFICEGGGTCTTNSYCSPSTQYPCAAGQKYYGRGPLQLSYNFNYGPAGQALGFDGLKNPNLLQTDGVLSWKASMWFWMTAASPKPSCHAAMTGSWIPSSTDSSLGRVPGYGAVTNIINGGVLGCGDHNPTRTDAEKSKIGYYNAYCQILGVTPGNNVNCQEQAHY